MNRSGHNDLRAVVGAAIFYVGDSPDQSPDNSSLSDTINTGGSGGPGPTEWPPSSSPLVQCNGHGRRGHSAEEEEEEEETIKPAGEVRGAARAALEAAAAGGQGGAGDQPAGHLCQPEVRAYQLCHGADHRPAALVHQGKNKLTVPRDFRLCF